MADAQFFRLPQPDEHTLIVGQNGSGKTQMGAWMLSESDFDRRPHIIIDFKRDDLLNKIKHIKRLRPQDQPPKAPGLYIRKSEPDDPYLEAFFHQVWKNNKTHIYIDETYMVDRDSKAFNGILTQGRSKQISTMSLTQRPTGCSRYLVSEASNFCVFRLNDQRDKKTLMAFLPPVVNVGGSDKTLNLNQRLQPFWSHWYAAKRDYYTLLQPVPSSDIILKRFDERLKPRKQFV